MTAADDAVRMLTLVPWLIERPGASIQEAASAFGVSEVVVRQDLERLDFCGLPGLGGGDLFEITIVSDRILVQMADELRRPLRLSPREALRLVLAVEAVAVAFGDELPALRSAVDKIRRAAGMEEGVAVELDPEGGRWLTPLRRALAEERRLRVRYQGRTDAAPRDRYIDPWALRVVDGAWYLQGRDDDAEGLRTFRLDRVADVEVLDEPRRFEPPDDELPTPRYVPAESDIEVHLHLEPRAAWLVDAIEPEHVAELESGAIEVRFHSDALAWVRRLLLGAGGGVDVQAPEALAQDLRSTARSALGNYRDVASEVASEPSSSDSS